LNLILENLGEAGSKCFNKSKVDSDKDEVFLILEEKTSTEELADFLKLLKKNTTPTEYQKQLGETGRL
jgi:hypothetical protein